MESRNTIQRGLVLSAARQLHHPSADEVYAYISAEHPTVSRATVYRNLGLLAEQSTLRRVSLPGCADRFDRTTEAHYHVRCRLCDRVDDADLPYREELIGSISDSRGYRIEGHEIVFWGVCPDCLAAGAEQPVTGRGSPEE